MVYSDLFLKTGHKLHNNDRAIELFKELTRLTGSQLGDTDIQRSKLVEVRPNNEFGVSVSIHDLKDFFILDTKLVNDHLHMLTVKFGTGTLRDTRYYSQSFAFMRFSLPGTLFVHAHTTFLTSSPTEGPECGVSVDNTAQLNIDVEKNEYVSRAGIWVVGLDTPVQINFGNREISDDQLFRLRNLRFINWTEAFKEFGSAAEGGDM